MNIKKNEKKFNLTKIAAVTLSAVLMLGCDDLELKTTSSDSDSSAGSSTDSGSGNVAANLYAAISDTSDTASGSLRYTLADDAQPDLTSGALSVDVTYPTGQDQDFSIGLYDASGSTSNMVADIILKSDGRIQTRIAGSGTTLAGFTHTPGTETNFIVTWDATTAEYTVKMDDVEIFSGEFNNTAATAVASFAAKLASNTKIAAQVSSIDNIKIYSDTAMNTLVFEDDFEDFTLNDDLVGGAAAYYSGNEAVVGGLESTDNNEQSTVTDDFESYTVGDVISAANTAWSTANIDNGSVAEVSTVKANGGTQSLYLADNDDNKPYAYREFTNSATSGSVSIDVYTPSENTKTTYINIGTGKNNSDRYFEVRLSSSIGYENSADGDVTLTSFSKDAWHTVTIAWTDANLVTVSLDGTEVATAIDQTTLGLDSTTPTQFTMYTGDSASTVNSVYFDNLNSELF